MINKYRVLAQGEPNELDLCIKCGFVRRDHTEAIRKRNKKEGEEYPCKNFGGDTSQHRGKTHQ